MQYIIIVVKDRVADTYGMPMCVPSVGQGIRSFTDEVNRVDATNLLNKHPGDFDLYQIGSYDDATAMITQDSIPKQLILGKDCVIKG